jgi:hypothetical protein
MYQTLVKALVACLLIPYQIHRLLNFKCLGTSLSWLFPRNARLFICKTIFSRIIIIIIIIIIIYVTIIVTINDLIVGHVSTSTGYFQFIVKRNEVLVVTN